MTAPRTADERPGLAARMLMMPIRGWRALSTHLPPRCRFHPSCSQYALHALARYGAVRGSWLALWRLARCHPWHPGGFDPVPSGPARTPVRTRRARSLRVESRS